MSSNTDDQFKEIREVVYKTKDTVERVESNWDKDRKIFLSLLVELGIWKPNLKSLT
jgi:hypothetical protein